MEPTKLDPEEMRSALCDAADEALSTHPRIAGLLLAAERVIQLMLNEVANARREAIVAHGVEGSGECKLGGLCSPSADPTSPYCVKCGEASFDPDEAPAIVPSKSEKHRHVFEFNRLGANVCTKCGKVKAAGGRKAAPAESPRQLDAPLPAVPPVPSSAPPRLRTADDFEDGTMGGSGVRR